MHPHPRQNTATTSISGGYEALLVSPHRYSFNGKERDDEVSGEGNSLSFKYRVEDTRLGRFFSVDPLFRKYSYNSTYAFAENDVIRNIDLEGIEKGGLPAQETNAGTTTAVDNTTVVGTAEEQQKVNPIPQDNGTI